MRNIAKPEIRARALTQRGGERRNAHKPNAYESPGEIAYLTGNIRQRGERKGKILMEGERSRNRQTLCEICLVVITTTSKKSRENKEPRIEKQKKEK